MLMQPLRAPAPNPLPQFLSAAPTNVISELVELFIAELDARDGDPDLADNGDEFDGSYAAEDEFMLHFAGVMPEAGCPVADPDICLAGDDMVRAGSAVDPAAWAEFRAVWAVDIGSDDDAEVPLAA